MARIKTTNEDTLSRISVIADDLTTDIHDAQTVVGVATETYGEDNEPFLGVLDLLDTKLKMIENAVADVVTLAPYRTKEQQKQGAGTKSSQTRKGR